MSIDTPEWVRDAIFYQIFPDRFARSGRVPVPGELEAWDADPTPHGFKGGDLYGVIDHLDHLQELGITAIYFCPIFASASNHRYHTYNYFEVDPLLGGNDALRLLLDATRERGMKVVLDGVFNHASRGFWQFHHVLENGDASPYRDWFHFDPERLHGHKPFQPYPGDAALRQLADGVGSYEAVGYSAWWNLPALPKFNTDCPEVREFLMTVAEHWIEFGIDGWRLDVPNEINDDEFWRDFRRRVRAINSEAYIVGEVWSEATHWLQGDMWDAVMNYQITAACLGFFGGSNLDFEQVHRPSSFRHVNHFTAEEFVAAVDRATSIYPLPIVQSQLNLLDSHDMPRFLTCCRGDKSALKMAWLFLCTLPGAPCVYYGDEVGLDGRHDPDCRKAFPWDKSRWDHDLLHWYKACIRLRTQHSAFRHGTRSSTVVSKDCVVISYGNGSDSLTLAFNAGVDAVRLDRSHHAIPNISDLPTNHILSARLVTESEVEVPSRSAVILSAS